MPRRKRRKPTTAKTQEELAKLVGRSPTAISKWLRRPDWPFRRRPPWDAAKVALWVRTHLAHDPAAIPGGRSDPSADAGVARLEHQARAQVLANRALLLRQQFEHRAGHLHSVADCQERRLRQIHAVKAALLDLPILAGALAGQSREEIEAAVRARVEAILKIFSGDDA